MVRDLIRSQHGECSLRSIFADPGITKIMHGCDSDLKYLVADLGVVTINLIDTARVFAFISRLPRAEVIVKDSIIQSSKHVNFLSLEKLVKLLLNIDLDKFFQVSDWRIRPLPQGMLEYARSDSHYLIPIYLILMELISPNGLNSLHISQDL